MKDIILKEPELDFAFPLMKALENRRTKRKWSDEELPLGEISNILWAACGETKPATKRAKNRRTMPSGCNSQLVHVYVALKTGVYEYIESEHKLRFVVDEDVRSILGTQKMMKSAPFGLIYVADFDKSASAIMNDVGKKMFIGGAEAAMMSQNVYLYSTAKKLNTVLLALTDRKALGEKIKLSDTSEIIYTQIVGFPPEE